MEVALVATAVAILSSAYYTKTNADHQKKVIKQNNENNIKATVLQDKQAQLALDEQRRKNKNLLAQQQAAYKARLGATNLSGKNGSGQTYLNAMQKEFDMEDKYLVNQAKLSSEGLLNNLGRTTSTNLLKLSTINNESQANTYNTLGNITGGIGRTMIK